ncbi:hypothetical protein MicloDRAFT_00061740 [Microvirga lotononidis]|uniref:Uncharacterized protein n=1 Tax=Microvirga lotononidis TaxID=864069 RepID=I4YNA5_9HYPH|nr:hypothetical protein MicloDRAFT_00061740 [Microvirga lotononidis]
MGMATIRQMDVASRHLEQRPGSVGSAPIKDMDGWNDPSFQITAATFASSIDTAARGSSFT